MLKFTFKNTYTKGFTLVELLVVLGLFSMIATLALGSLFNTQSINTKLQQTQSILDNLSLSIQTMTRDIRYGSTFYCIDGSTTTLGFANTARRSCTNGSSFLIFRPADFATTTDRSIYYVEQGILFKDEYTNGSSTPNILQMTSDDVIIKSLTFFVDGAQSSDGSNDYNNANDYKQPSIRLLVSGVTKAAFLTKASSTFNIETTVSPRELDK